MSGWVGGARGLEGGEEWDSRGWWKRGARTGWLEGGISWVGL